MRRFFQLPLLALLFWSGTTLASDWATWRGPEGTGVSREKDLPETFSLRSGKNVVWRQPYGAISTPIVMNGRVYIINRTGTGQEKGGQGVDQQERIMCFDAKKGTKIWEHRFNVFLTDIVASRLGWGNVCGDPETGYVYAQGTQGFLFCLDGKDGKVIWERSMTEEYGRVTGYGGRVTSPIVDGDLLILSIANASWGAQAIGMTRFVAFNKKTGKVVWWGDGGYRVRNTFYSIPIVAVINGQRLLIGGGGDGCVHAFKVHTGEKVWSYKFDSGAINCSPVVQGTKVFIGGSGANPSGTQGKVICLDAGEVKDGKPKLVWKTEGIRVWFSSLLLHEGRLYMHNDRGLLFCVDTKDGKQLWDARLGTRNTKGSPVWADGKIYQTGEDNFLIFKLTDTGLRRLAKVRFRPQGKLPVVELDGSPAVANGRIYFATTDELVCIGKPNHEAKADPIPPAPKAKPAAKGAKPAHLQVVPADVMLSPGETVEFKVRTFDADGQFIGETSAEWSLAGMLPPVFPIGLPRPPRKGPAPKPAPAIQGELSAKSGSSTALIKFTASKGVPAQFGRVVARAGDLTAHARVRVAPTLPYETNFSKVPVGKIPAGWVGCQGKFLVTALKDKQLLKKRNNNPNALLAQSYTFISRPTLKDYTIEADVMGMRKGANLPDLGVVANRYTLALEGNTQRLRILSWEVDPPRGRINKTIDWSWKPGVWYTMKLTVSVADGKATVRGKVWEKDEEEPSDWSLAATDPNPNTEGSPGIYGYSKGINEIGALGTEIYYDRVKIMPNK